VSAPSEVRIRPVVGLPEIAPGDPLGALIARQAGELVDGDVIVVSQKVVSKAEGRIRRLSSVIPSAEASKLARILGKEPNMVQLILEESAEVIRAERGVLIVETKHGLVCANAGIDSSNISDPESVLLLPEDPDVSARRLRAEIGGAAGATIGVVIADSFGRAWRIGQAEVAIGCAGLMPLDDWRGRRDANGRELIATLIAVADEAAAAADLVRDKAAAVPAAVIGGLGRWVGEEDGPGAAAIRRPREEDLFR
jgi:coenzyme F420-0:L-glutamate ligase/coenzyme F420-1:gamma-L-glutamate ligase